MSVGLAFMVWYRKDMTNITLNNPLFDSLFGHHDNKNTPFIHVYGERTITHKEFLFLVGRMANAISSLGVTFKQCLYCN